MAKAKERADDPRWWAQCDGDFKSLDGEVAKIPESERAPFTAASRTKDVPSVLVWPG